MYEKQLEQLRNEMASSTPKHDQNETKITEDSKQNDSELKFPENLDEKQSNNERAIPSEDDNNYEKTEEYLGDNYTEETNRDWDEDRYITIPFYTSSSILIILRIFQRFRFRAKTS